MARRVGSPSARSIGVRTPLRESRTLKNLDLDAAFFWLIVAFLCTVILFFSLRPRNVQLTGKQVAEYERRTQFLANSTVYIIETGRPEGLLSVFPPANWAKVSTGIDFVAYVYDDLPLFLTEPWVEAAERALRAPDTPHYHRAAKGIGIALFPCGCVLPNEYFTRVSQRLGGAECALLPGWVLPNRDVHWLDVPDPGNWRWCRGRADVLEKRGARANAKELQAIRKTIALMDEEIANATAVKVDVPALAAQGVVSKPAVKAAA